MTVIMHVDSGMELGTPHVRGECSKAFASCDMCLSVLAQVKLSQRTGPVFAPFSLCLVILLSPLQPLLPPCPATLMELAKLDDMTKRREIPAGEIESSPGKTATYDFCTGVLVGSCKFVSLGL